jgi:hypothetical protein
MPRIRCRYLDCSYLDEGYCGAAAVILDPDEGCLTYTQIDEVADEAEWEDEELEELWDEEEDLLSEDDEEIWLEEDEI